jgi:hypothetical protein
MIGAIVAFGLTPFGLLDESLPGPLPAVSLAEDPGVLLLAAEAEIYLPGTSGTALMEPHGMVPMGLDLPEPAPAADFTTLRAADRGWVTREADPVGLQGYPPILLGGIAIDRALDLAPGGQGAAAGWGSIRFANEGGALTALAASRNADGRAVRVRIGRCAKLPHGILRDPAWLETAELIAGIGAALTLEEDGQVLRLDLRDPGYWLDRVADATAYAGTGGIEGGTELAGKPKPKLRGGTASDPVREISPILVDATAGIYQVSDAPGAVVTLYERGLSGGITSAGTVADITAASPSAATYVVESSARGLFVRLGTFPPAGQITVDAWGAFPDGATPSIAADVALELLRQDLGMPRDYLDAGSFAGVAAAAPWPAGVWSADPSDEGVQLVGLLLRSAGARLVPRRVGQMAAVALRAIGAGNIPVASYTTAQILRCEPRPLSAPLAPPPFRVRVGWGRFYTTQVSDIPATVGGPRLQALAEQWRIAPASSAGVLTAWRRPSDPAPVETALTSSTGGQALADALRDLWCVEAGRKLYDVTLPLGYALRHDIGEPIHLTYPGALAGGALGRIVGEQLRTADNAAILQVLV